MSNLAFDTLKFARALRDRAKLPSEQAEGIAAALADTIKDDIATKADIQAVRNDLRGAEERLKEELTHKIETVREELTHKIEVVSADLRATEERLKGDLTHKIEVVSADLRATEERLKGDLTHKIEVVGADLRATEDRLKAVIFETKADLMKWMYGAMGFQTLVVIGAVAGLIKLLHS